MLLEVIPGGVCGEAVRQWVAMSRSGQTRPRYRRTHLMRGENVSAAVEGMDPGNHHVRGRRLAMGALAPVGVGLPLGGTDNQDVVVVVRRRLRGLGLRDAGQAREGARPQLRLHGGCKFRFHFMFNFTFDGLVDVAGVVIDLLEFAFLGGATGLGSS